MAELPDPLVELATAPKAPVAGEEVASSGTEIAMPDAGVPGFQVRLANFTGPFDLLLNLIGKHDLDITEVALATVTDEFIAHVKALSEQIGADVLDQTTEFLVMASTLLDLKAARLLPRGEVEDEEDLARLEARDLLFARLLQYKAFKEAARTLADLLDRGRTHIPRQVAPDDPDVTRHLPELVWNTTPEAFAAIAEKALARKPEEPDGVNIEHIHAQPVSVREQAGIIAARLREAGVANFHDLAEDASASLVVIARFLALLEMYRDRAVGFEQVAPLTELVVHWLGREDWDAAAGIEDDYIGTPASGQNAGEED
ncbi:ScpA family protein [Galactobacter sp.]|uniref:segregation and condensation protein A n=1 Tax=Galactobacter sp. TaxID=2676125 RepID=UPI00345CB9DB